MARGMTRTVLVALSLALAGCVGDDEEAGGDDGLLDGNGTDDGNATDTNVTDGNVTDGEAQTNSLSFVAIEEGGDYGFTGPDEASAGWTEISLENEGRETHHIQLLYLENRTWEEFLDVFQAQSDPNASGPPPDWIHQMGGPNAAAPGNTTRATVMLEPGTYALACFIPGPDGAPHAFHGMLKQLNVTEADADTAKPETTATITLTDYNFTWSDDFTAGTHEVGVVNDGDEPHEAALIGLAEDATAMDFIQAVEGGAGDGPPPGHGAGGVTFFDPGLDGTMTLELESGRYAFICFAHIEEGMIREFEVA